MSLSLFSGCLVSEFLFLVLSSGWSYLWFSKGNTAEIDYGILEASLSPSIVGVSSEVLCASVTMGGTWDFHWRYESDTIMKKRGSIGRRLGRL